MKKLLIGIVVALLIVGCGMSYDETKRLKQEKRTRELREDSAALKVAVMPTLDCLPLYVAEEREMFDTVVDIRLKYFTAQMDCDTALQRGRVEMAVSDLVRAERMKGVRRQESGVSRNMTIGYVTATNAYWLLIANRNQRITDLKHLDDHMLAMTRYSVTDLLGDLAVDSAKLKTERVFRIQVNDVNVRLDMLENNEMDALLLTQPQVTQALLLKHHVLLDTRKLDMQMGAIAMQSGVLQDKWRKVQLKVFIKGYNAACDSINKYGISHYRNLVMKYCKVKREAVDTIPQSLKVSHIAKPRTEDIERAQKWLSKK